MKKYDERNTMFSRLTLKDGTKEYQEFYDKNPELKEADDSLRGITFRDELKESERYKDLFNPLIASNKLYYKSLFDLVSNFEVKEKKKVDKSFTKNIKEITKYFGATDVGITKLTKDLYYTNFGGLSDALRPNDYGDIVVPEFKTAIVFTMKMDLDKINRAPHFEELLATEEAYFQVAITGARLTMYLKSLGYDAFYNHSEFYLAPLVPLAYEAGLGQIGMSNHIVTLEHGDNVRLGAVFTNLELEHDSPIDFGLTEFCKRCALCLINCPSSAITHKPRDVNGRQFYKFDDQKCLFMWTKTGTDCGICIQSCPFTQGVDLEKAKMMIENPSLMDEMMEEHLEKFTRRKYTKHKLDIVKLDNEDD